MWVGQAGHRKGLDVALEAVRAARRVEPDVRLKVAGVPPGSAEPGIEYLGIVDPDDIAKVYRNSDALLFPTRYESFGLVVVEAMAAGLPIVTSDAVPEGIVEDLVNGYVVAGHDPADYAAALVRLARDPELVLSFSETNRAEAKRFSLESAAAKYARVALQLVPPTVAPASR